MIIIIITITVLLRNNGVSAHDNSGDGGVGAYFALIILLFSLFIVLMIACHCYLKRRVRLGVEKNMDKLNSHREKKVVEDRILNLN